MKLGRDFSETILSRIVTVVAVLSILFVIQIAFGISSANKTKALAGINKEISLQRMRVLLLSHHYRQYLEVGEKKPYRRYILLQEADNYDNFLDKISFLAKLYLSDDDIEIVSTLKHLWKSNMYPLILKYNEKNAEQYYLSYVKFAPQSASFLDVLAKKFERRLDIEIQNEINNLLFFLGTELTFIIWIIYFFNSKIAKPIRNLTILTRKFSGDGFYKTSNIPTSRELRELSQAFNDMTEKVNTRTSELENKASKDPLTGLYNRRAFEELFATRIEVDGHKELSLMLIDIDYFKKINDVYGHQIGDEVLKETASIISSIFRENDIFCRYGGEEFIVALFDQDVRRSRVVAERVRLVIEDTDIKAGNDTIKLTVSIGIAHIKNKIESLEKTISIADNELYRAKNSGRNKVCMNI
ncbi:MAG: GGDEF domain-containing protein [Gammaproteobacteria bacterium]|nr:GGDEF domain-containing protein [Gammaproteobacteria bacterium]